MDLIQIFILSVIEGVTEFLPISSTGHLILASKLLNLAQTDFLKTFEIAIQLGAIMAVVVLYFKKFITGFDIYKKLIVGFIPTALVGFFLYPLIKDFFLGSTITVLASLFMGGIILIFTEDFIKVSKIQNPITTKQAFLIGVFQSISVIPGVSRAAATIIGGLLMGLDRKTATEFSFLLAVPTMFAATALDIYKSRDILTTLNIPSLLLGIFLSFIFALIAVKFLINYVKNNNFKMFGVYRIVLAILFWLFVK